jgi:hypothetical protein
MNGLKNVVFKYMPQRMKFSFPGKWIKLENIILSEIIQAQKARSSMFSLICGI